MAVNAPELDPLEASRAPFVEHLRELRYRLLIAIAAIGVGFAISWTWTEEIFAFLLAPLQEAALQQPTGDKTLAQMHHRDLTEPFFVLLKTAFFGGVVLAVPVLMYQVWAFIAPGLYPDERRTAGPFVVVATLCFLIGGAFSYYGIMPYAYAFLLEFSDGVSKPDLMMKEYLGITTKLILAFGFIFEMPVITTFLAKVGVVNYKQMLRFWRYALVLCFIVGAMLTPPDLISQVMLAGPMILLYFISIGCAYLFGHRPTDTPDEASA